jgi:hypothetical protein
MKCYICGEEFTPLRKDAKCCSAKCRMKASRNSQNNSPIEKVIKPPKTKKDVVKILGVSDKKGKICPRCGWIYIGGRCNCT